jgi:hypothetical protein
MVQSKKYNIKPTVNDEADLLFSHSDRDAELGCIGHLRADFGRTGDEFWTSWWEHCGELKTQAFKDELDEVVNHLRESGNMLDGYNGLMKFCGMNPDSRLESKYRDDSYGFRIDTDNHSYLLRGCLTRGDYNLYCYCYDRGRLEQYLVAARQTPEPEPEQAHELLMDSM